jgi:hypothetical protein
MKDTCGRVTATQFVLGIIGILLINLFQNKNKTRVKGVKTKHISTDAGWNIIGNDIFYYLAVGYIPFPLELYY